MADQPKNSPDQSNPQPPSGPVRQVVVTHLDSPPPLGKETIHPRRPAPIVPTREANAAGKSSEDSD